MEDKTLIKISVFISLIGLAFLFYLSNNSNLIDSNIISAEEGDTIKISGKIANVEENGKLTIISVTSPVDVIVFDNMTFEKGDNITVIGNIELFQGKKEITATKVYHSTTIHKI